MQKIICKKCGKEIDLLEAFSGDLCLECYSIEYDKMSEEDKRPRFDNSLLNTIK